MSHDLLIRNGRVIDPETRFDEVCDVAIADGLIAAIGTDLGPARREIDATGKIVCPGFIDLHAHGQSVAADRMQAFDGVTTTLELEVGALPVASISRRAGPRSVPTAAISPSAIATSQTSSKRVSGSTTRPFRISRSCVISALSPACGFQDWSGRSHPRRHRGSCAFGFDGPRPRQNAAVRGDRCRGSVKMRSGV